MKTKLALVATATLLVSGTATLLISGTREGAQADAPRADAPADTQDTTEAKIARAMSAGPADVASGARITDTDAKEVVLREGTNGFTCMPGDPKAVGKPAMCADAVSMQWFADFAAHKPKPTNTVPGITYMLAGATQRSDSDPNDTTSPSIPIGPHWMIMWPFDPKATGLPDKHHDSGAYIMWGGTPWAHLHVMGRP